MLLKINGKDVPVEFPAQFDEQTYAQLLNDFVPLQQWCKNIDQNLEIQKVEVQSIDLFGKRIGFLKFKSIALLKTANKIIPGIVFMRGDAVAVLVVVKSAGKTQLLLTEQYRVPIGGPLLEICAGMCDGDGNLQGVALKELEEETGLKLNKSDLMDLGSFYPSAGGCDEKLHLFVKEIELSDEELAKMTSRLYGEHDSGEVIRLRLVGLEDAWDIPDAKLLVALGRYQKKLKQ